MSHLPVVGEDLAGCRFLYLSASAFNGYGWELQVNRIPQYQNVITEQR